MPTLNNYGGGDLPGMEVYYLTKVKPQWVILACGSRDWTDYQTIKRVLAEFPAATLLVHGDNGDHDPRHEPPYYGADRQAAYAAQKRFYYFPKAYPADWNRYGKSAGPRRNRLMLDENPIQRVLAFHPNLATSKGTKDMVRLAIEARIPVTLITGYRVIDDNEQIASLEF
jgi:hypothetical protein